MQIDDERAVFVSLLRSGKRRGLLRDVCGVQLIEIVERLRLCLCRVFGLSPQLYIVESIFWVVLDKLQFYVNEFFSQGIHRL